MRISLTHRFVAIANPRCGSSSLRGMLDRHCPLKGPETCDLPAHASLRRVEAWLAGQGHDPEAFFWFTTVRNPWDRVVSIYHYGLKNPASIWHQPAVAAGSFRAFVLGSDRLEGYFRPGPDRAGVQDGPYVIDALMRDGAGRPRGTVFRLERFGALVEALEARYGIALRPLHNNITQRGAYRGYYDDETRARVAYLLEADIARFGYSF